MPLGRTRDPVLVAIAVAVASATVEGQAQVPAPPLQPAPGATAVATFARVGRPLRPFHFVRGDGRSLTPQDVDGKPVVFLLWAPECLGAQRIVSATDTLRVEAESAGAVLYFVSLDTAVSRVRTTLAGRVRDQDLVFATDWKHVFTDPEIEARYVSGTIFATVIPSLVVLDAQGIVRVAEKWEDDRARLLTLIRDAVGSHRAPERPN
jgi:hypothetical protein